ncbi:hypothetical protein BDV30DRAFT_108227 [Aspergillus minisclerotigenes]|uniref:Uncharacterized protein n=1 Tax=Aspergillus minisclerotigenes TaxID=656917 RepID=A0A5N6J5F6_9EURO|nr:hypothetical protein BDV30DRAFT_108227 [Aspergillus minisclerotigenes]
MVLYLLVGSRRVLTGPFFLPSFTTPDPDILPISFLSLTHLWFCASPPAVGCSPPQKLPASAVAWDLRHHLFFPLFLFYFSLLRPIVIINQFSGPQQPLEPRKENRPKA